MDKLTVTFEELGIDKIEDFILVQEKNIVEYVKKTATDIEETNIKYQWAFDWDLYAKYVIETLKFITHLGEKYYLVKNNNDVPK